VGESSIGAILTCCDHLLRCVDSARMLSVPHPIYSTYQTEPQTSCRIHISPAETSLACRRCCLRVSGSCLTSNTVSGAYKSAGLAGKQNGSVSMISGKQHEVEIYVVLLSPSCAQGGAISVLRKVFSGRGMNQRWESD
jgi:hypothetical protein